MTAGGDAEPAFTAPAPLMWDSPPPPAGLATVTNSAGTLVSVRSGLPVSSSATAPGAGAQVSAVSLSVSGSTITLAPPAAALSAPAADFPLYIDPGFNAIIGTGAANWTQVDSGFATTSYWNESSDLQVGDCVTGPPPGGDPSCDNLGVARSLFTLPIPDLGPQATVVQSDLYLDNVVSDSCTAEPVQLWTTKPISSSTTWNTQNASGFWQTQVESESYAHGYSGCPASQVGYDITTLVTPLAASGATETFGLKAQNETTMAQWKQFASGASNITISTEYYDPPLQPGNPSANGGCGTAASPAVIGNDDVVLEATASDPDGDTALTTTFTVRNSAGTVEAAPAVTTGEDTAAITTILRATLAGWSPAGGTYSFSAVTQDQNGALSPATAACYFDWNPNAPAAPGVTVSSPASGEQVIGGQVTIDITPPAGCGTLASPCPASHTYQLGAAVPESIAVGSGGCTSTSCDVAMTVSQRGPIAITVTGVADGNPGPAASASVTGLSPSPAYPDGYFTGGSYPDLLAVGSGSDPSLWLSPGTGAGTVGPAIDIGSAGTGVPPAGYPDGPADWNGAQILHGDFTGNGVQDVMAYYPAGNNAGYGSIIDGSGDAATLNSVNDPQVQSTDFRDEMFPNPADIPLRLVAAGDASQAGPPGFDDLIGIYGDPANGYELNLYAVQQGVAGSYKIAADLSQGRGGPDGDPWNDFQLATVQANSYPGEGHTADPEDVALLALDTVNGQLWESQNPGCPLANPAATCSTTELVGMPGLLSGTGTWTQLTGTLPATLTAADVNSLGDIELWSVSGTTITSYTVTGSTVSSEASSALTEPSNDWPVTDGAVNSPGNCTASTPATAADTITGSSAAIDGTASWACDDTFTKDLSLTGSGYVVPPASTIPASGTALSLSVWFKTSTADGVLASLSDRAMSAGPPTSGPGYPVMYIGSDGKLNAEWYNTLQSPAVSAAAVDDGLWHHAVLTACDGRQTLSIDGQAQATVGGTPDLNLGGTATNLTLGAGYLGGNWPDERYWQSAATADYFTGQLSGITFSQPATCSLPAAPALPAGGALGDVTGDGISDVLAADATGNLWLYPSTGGTGESTFGTPSQVGAGWTGYTIAAVAPLYGSARAGILAADTAGNLWYYPNTGGTGGNTFGTRSQDGTGWTGYTIVALTDLDDSGAPGIVARDSSGSLWYYPNTGGTGESTFGTPTQIGQGWNGYTIDAADFNGDGKPDLLAISSSGALYLYPNAGGTGFGTFGTPLQINGNWTGYQAIDAGRLTGAAGADIITLDTSGNLWLHANTGDLTNFGTATQIKSSLTGYTIN